MTEQSSTSPLATARRLAVDLLRELVPTVLFFFSVFIVIFVLFKLFVAQYSIEYTAFSKAAIGALILGKVVPILDWADSGYRFESYRRITVVAGKTIVYAIVVVILGIGEQLVEAYRDQPTFHAAMQFVLAKDESQRFLGLVLLISLVVGAYLTAQELDRAFGKGALVRTLLERPAESRKA